MFQYAILDLKEPEFGCESELVTTKKCDSPKEKLMIPLFLHNMGSEIAVCALIDLIRSGFGHRMPTTDGKRSQS